VARSCYLLQKLPGAQLSPLDPHWEDDLLRYGQKIRLLAHPAVQVSPAATGCQVHTLAQCVCRTVDLLAAEAQVKGLATS